VLLAEPDWEAWRAELARMQAAADGDTERQMDALRHFQHAQTFRLLAQDLAGTLTVERLADHLSALATSSSRRRWPRRGSRCTAARRARLPRPCSRSSVSASWAARSWVRVGSRSRVPLRRCRRNRRGAVHATRGAAHHLAHERDGRRSPLRYGPAAAPRRRERRADIVVLRVSPLRARAGVDVGAPGVDARPLRRRRRVARREVRRRARIHPARRARPRDARRTT
jgi:hypothetical protein